MFRVEGLGFIVSLKSIEYGCGYILIRSPYTGSLLFRVPNPMALCQNHCALRNGSFVSLKASLLKGIHLIQTAGHAGFETIFGVWPLLI